MVQWKQQHEDCKRPLFWACVSGCQVWDEMPGFAGKDSSGVATFPWGFWVTLASGLAQNTSPSAEPAVR